MAALFKWFTLLVLTALLVLFAVVNRHDLAISLYPLPFDLELPVYLFVAIFFLMGFMISYLLMSVRSATDNLALRKCRKRIDALENELRGLRIGRTAPTNTPQHVTRELAHTHQELRHEGRFRY